MVFKFKTFLFFNYLLFKPSIFQAWASCLIIHLQFYEMPFNIPTTQMKKVRHGEVEHHAEAFMAGQ